MAHIGARVRPAHRPQPAERQFVTVPRAGGFHKKGPGPKPWLTRNDHLQPCFLAVTSELRKLHQVAQRFGREVLCFVDHEKTPLRVRAQVLQARSQSSAQVVQRPAGGRPAPKAMSTLRVSSTSSSWVLTTTAGANLSDKLRRRTCKTVVLPAPMSPVNTMSGSPASTWPCRHASVRRWAELWKNKSADGVMPNGLARSPKNSSYISTLSTASVPGESREGSDHETRTPRQGYLVGLTIDFTCSKASHSAAKTRTAAKQQPVMHHATAELI